MGERGTSSQVFVVRISHGWLEVEEGGSSREEKEEVTVNKPELVPWKDPCSPFYMPRGAGYMSREIVSELLHAQQVCGRKVFSSCSWSRRP
jgi:hypothetical protein